MKRWEIVIEATVEDDLQWIGKRGKEVINKAIELLEEDPLKETRNMKTLRPNAFAEREVRVLGKYRVLFNVEVAERRVKVLLAGEKRGNQLIARGEEFTKHHESRTTEQSEGEP